jgi:eukaryotic-like serine/threonine-protein kinase
MTIARSDWPRLLNLLEQALDLPDCARDAWLRTLDLPATLKEALAGLIEERQAIETSDFLADMPALPEGAHAHAAARFGAGALIGPWRLLREIGRGGMSMVWLAERADEQLRRQVALKLPHAGPGQDLLAQRLLRERNILAALEHRNIARLYDVGLMDGGTPYLVMEYVAGDTLLAHADARRLTIPQRLALFQQVLRAVQYAHGKLVLHRDLKPSNILVNEAGDVKLLDFGIAKLLADNGGSSLETELTRHAGHLLTPGYASPEQLRGKPLGTGSDVYSLGVMLYALLCGRGPHAIEGASAARLEDAVLNLEPKAPSRQTADARVLEARSTSAAGLRKTLAGDLDAIVLKALAKTPEQRYASADALGAELSRWLAGEPIAARAPSAWRHLARFAGRHRWAVASSTVAIVLLISASGVALMQARAATQQAGRATAVRDFLVALFNETDRNLAGAKELTAKTMLANGQKRALSSLTQTPDLMAELLQEIGRAQAGIADLTSADRSFSQAVDTYRRIQDRRSELLALLAQADNALAMGRNEHAQTLLSQAEILYGPYQNDMVVTSKLLPMRGYVAGFKDNWALAKASFEGYLALSDTGLDKPPLTRVEVLQSLATAVSTLSNDLPRAMSLFEQALQILHEHPEIPITARIDVVQYRQDLEFKWGQYGHIQHTSPEEIRDCHRTLSANSLICLKLTGRLQAAQLRLGLYDQAMSLNTELAPMLDPASPRDQANAAIALTRTLAFNRRLGERPDLVERLKQIALPGPNNPLDPSYRLKALNTLAEVHLLTGPPAEALVWVAQAAKLAAEHQLDQSAHGRKTRLLEGVALHRQGQPARALTVMAHFCSAPERAAGQTRVEDHFLSLNCVPPLVASGQLQPALSLLEKALPVLRDNLGPEAPTVQQAQRWLDGLRSGRGLPSFKADEEALFS